MTKKFVWQDLPRRQGLFTRRNATMVNLDNNKIIQYYSTNTKIVVVQKCVTPAKTYYRTESAKTRDLNWAFEAAAFGLPNEFAPPVQAKNTSPLYLRKPEIRTLAPAKKQKVSQETATPKGGEGEQKLSFWKRLFRRSDG